MINFILGFIAGCLAVGAIVIIIFVSKDYGELWIDDFDPEKAPNLFFQLRKPLWQMQKGKYITLKVIKKQFDPEQNMLTNEIRSDF